jgi:hypothetical protein
MAISGLVLYPKTDHAFLLPNPYLLTIHNSLPTSLDATISAVETVSFYNLEKNLSKVAVIGYIYYS